METLPDELLPGILCLLPVKCLLRIKCVSRYWHALISSPDFVKLHLKRSVQTNNRNLYLTRIIDQNLSSDFYRMDFNTLEENQGNLQPARFDYNPLSHLDNGTKILGSCDGLLCIANTLNINLLWCSSTKSFINMSHASLGELRNQPVNIHQYISFGFGYENNSYNPLRGLNHITGLGRFGLGLFGDGDGFIDMTYTHDIIAIWNPSTRKSIKLPLASMIDMPNQYNIQRAYTYGFGYDRTNDDYKVVRLVSLGHDYEINVYSLRSNSWHMSEKYSNHYPHLGGLTDNAIAGGAMHWISIGADNNLFILAFDLGTETYRVIEHPQYRDFDFNAYLSSLGGCLSITCHHSSGIVDVWLLKEYGGENEYWLRLAQNIHVTSDHHVKMVAYSENGKKVLLRIDNYLYWFNIELEILEYISLLDAQNNVFYFGVLDSCLESLV